MTVNLPHNALAQAIASSARSGSLPEDQHIAAAELTPEAFPVVQAELEKSLRGVNDEIRKISRSIAPDVDSWIRQAKQLQADIEQAKSLAQDIVRKAEEAELIRTQEEDARKKVDLLKTEVSFTSNLTTLFEQIRIAHASLLEAQASSHGGNIGHALQHLDSVRNGLAVLGPLKNTTAVQLLSRRADVVRTELRAECGRRWNGMLHVDPKLKSVILPAPALASGELAQNIAASEQLGLLDDKVDEFCQVLKGSIISPLLGRTTEHQGFTIDADERGLRLTSMPSTPSPEQTIASIRSLTTTLDERLTAQLVQTVSNRIMPTCIELFIRNCLMQALPTTVDESGDVAGLLAKVSSLSDHLAELGWPGGAELTDWNEQAPRNWLSKRREQALASTRHLLLTQLHDVKSVERVETQTVTHDDPISGANGMEDEWNGEWTEEDEQNQQTAAKEPEDTNAWDWNEEGESGGNNAAGRVQSNGDKEEDEDDGAAWGWEETGTSNGPPSPNKERRVVSTQASHGQLNAREGATERQVTLKETYFVTAVPDKLLSLIEDLGHDTQKLNDAAHSSSPIAAAAGGLHSIPTLILAGYRALALSHYQDRAGGNMFLYNDSSRLADQLSGYIQDEPSWLSPRMKLEAEVTILQSFSRRAYGKEMESQRTILRDLLDGAQGFTSCTEQPFKAACENAVSAVVDHIRGVSAEWSKILSSSALLQSLGSLLSTVCSKMIIDIEDLNDIGDEESKKLRSFFNEIGKLASLFTQEGGSDLTGVYTPNWFKFQYLSEIMESSLADIKYLWSEGELKLEFEASEVMDLIEALFADTEHRRRAINEIKRG